MNASAQRTVTVLGSTGSVGTQTVQLLTDTPGRFRVRAGIPGGILEAIE